MKVSVVVLTKNEAVSIKDCLGSARQLADEMIVVDDHSEDRTAEAAKASGARVFSRSLKGDFASQRNFGLQKAKADWVLFLDADERLTLSLLKEIKKQCLSGRYDGFYLKRKDFFLGRWLRFGETARVRFLRLAKKDSGQWQRKVHEVWQVKGRVGELKNPLLHYPHPTIERFLDQINQYTSLNAIQMVQEGKRLSCWQMIFYPLAKFFQNYCWRLGFLDGFPGLAIAWLMSFHSLVTRVKLWEKQC